MSFSPLSGKSHPLHRAQIAQPLLHAEPSATIIAPQGWDDSRQCCLSSILAAEETDF
jgi:hypothetical protein